MVTLNPGEYLGLDILVGGFAPGHLFAQLTRSVLTTAAIPFIRMTEKGHYRFRENDYVGLIP